MKHFLFPRRGFFAESRLVRFAGEAPSAPDTPPPTEAKTEKQPTTVDPKSAFRGAQDRMKSSAAKLEAMQKKLDQIKKVQSNVGQNPDVDAAEAQNLGLTDDEDNGFKDEIDDAVKTAEADVKKVSDEVNSATQESDQHLEAIAAKGPGGKLDAAFMRMSATMNDPKASLGEKLGAVIMAFAEMQNLFKGIGSPAAAPGAKGGKGPEANSSSPQGKKESVRQMMKDSDKDNVADLKTDRETKVTALKGQKGALEGAVTASKLSLANEQASLVTAKAALETNKDDPAKQTALREVQTRVTVADGAVKAAEQALASLNTDLAKAESDLKTIKGVEDDAKKSVEDFGQQKEIIEAKLTTLKDLPGLSDEQKDAVGELYDVLDWEDAGIASNGIDVTLSINPARMETFLVSMTKAGIDPKPMKIGTGGVIEDPAAFQAGMDQFIAKMTAAGAKKAEAPAAAPAAPAPAPAAAPAPGGPRNF